MEASESSLLSLILFQVEVSEKNKSGRWEGDGMEMGGRRGGRPEQERKVGKERKVGQGSKVETRQQGGKRKEGGTTEEGGREMVSGRRQGHGRETGGRRDGDWRETGADGERGLAQRGVKMQPVRHSRPARAQIRLDTARRF